MAIRSYREFSKNAYGRIHFLVKVVGLNPATLLRIESFAKFFQECFSNYWKTYSSRIEDLTAFSSLSGSSVLR